MNAARVTGDWQPQPIFGLARNIQTGGFVMNAITFRATRIGISRALSRLKGR